ncbi:hypothetical protein [Oleiharenicola lentus]|uniref:hypothetical protein n=1 Tax=Oleiharenicola lentus TaxID=2508720 RepID=UPI003F66A66B
MARDPILGKFATGRFPVAALISLKKERTYKQVRQLIKDASLYRLGERIDGHRRAESWSEIIQRTALERSKNWIQEFGWLAHSITRHGTSIQEFLKLSRIFERSVLLGDYGAAASNLDAIEQGFGKSLWLADSRLLVYQLKEGFTDQKEFLATLQNQCKTPIGSYILTIFSKRRESLLPHAFYDRETAQTLADLRESGMKSLANVVEFYASPWTAAWKENILDLFFRCNARTLVDKYQVCIKILCTLDRLAVQESDVAQLDAILADLYRTTTDERWLRAGSQLIGLEYSQGLAPAMISYLEISDLFYQGRFDEAAEQAEAEIQRMPEHFEFYVLLANSNACMKTPRPIAFGQNSMAHKLVNAMSEIAAQEVDINVALLELHQVAHRLGDSPLGIKIRSYALLEGEGSTDEDLSRQATISGEIFDLKEVNLLSDLLRNSLIKTMEALVEKNLTLGLQFWVEKNGEGGRLGPEVQKEFSSLALGRVSLKKNNYKEVLKVFTALETDTAESTRKSAFVASLRAPMEFTALVSEGRPNDAARLAVQNYAKNPNFLRHVTFEDLIDGVKCGRWPELAATPFYPILVYLNNAKEYEIYAALDEYLTASGLKSPIELVEKIPMLEVDVARVLMRDVMSVPILQRGAFWAKTPDEQRSIRTKILVALYALSVADQGMVIAELAEINKGKLIEQAYRNIEGPKFYLDFAQLYRRILPVVENSFERYLAFKEFEEKGGQLAGEEHLLHAAKLSEADATNTATASTQTSDSQLTTIIYVITGHYLWDDAKGFNGILRTRILHGSLENQLKRIFDAKNLLATKNPDESFVFKQELRGLIEMIDDGELRKGVEDAYIEFTRDVDRSFRDLMTKLRVRAFQKIAAAVMVDAPTHEMTSDDGILDFRDLFSEPTLEHLKKIQPKTALMAVAELQKLFREKAEEQFSGVRAYIASNTATMLNQAIDRLDKALEKISSDAIRGQLRQNLLQAKTGIIPDLQIIQNWFFIAESQDSSLTSFRGIIDAANHVVNFASNEKLGTISLDVSHDFELGVEAGVTLYEVIATLLRNIVQHSGIVNNQQVTIYAHVESGGKKTTVTITNKVSTSEHARAAVERARARIEEVADSRILHRAPGGTGLRRVRALLQQIGSDVTIAPRAADGAALFTIEIRY